VPYETDRRRAGFCRIISELKPAAIPNSAQILQAVIEATPDAIFVKDLDGRYVLINAAAARFIGKSPAEIVGKHDLELYPEETARGFIEADQQVLASGEAQAFEGVATSQLGTQAYLVTKGVYRDKDGRIIGLFGISKDITELRHANETLEQTRTALFRSQKMEAVGQLTGGLAHDFNNILAIILGNIELLRRHLPEDPETDEIINILTRATLHGQDVTGQLLAFSRRRPLNPRAVDVNTLVSDIVRLTGRTLGSTITVTMAAEREDAHALVDPAALEGAVLNVALNARDAMPAGGSLKIRTSRVEVTQEPATDDDLKPGAYIVVALQDTGTGMSADVIARAFEPFFTTKTGGKGSGLGLSMVYGFAKQSGGTVTIASTLGRGTTVSMFLPEAIEDTEHAAAGTGPAGKRVASRTILVVEDEADVRHVVRRQLEVLGHRVLVASSANEAMMMIDSPDGLVGTDPPDLLLTDVVLASGMDGIDLAVAARVARPDLPVIFMSGFTAVPEAQQRMRDTGAPLLSKPFSTAQLDRAVNAACA
jgi:PAS domain S-box-containing protein